MNLLTEEPGRLHVTIASFGDAGNDAAGLLAAFFQKENYHCRFDAVFFRAEESTEATGINTIVASSDIVFILGSDDDIAAPGQALSIAMICKEHRIPCYTILTRSASSAKTSIATQNLCSASSNVLLIPLKNGSNALAATEIMMEAVLNMIVPMFGRGGMGRGLIGIDFTDIKTVLGCGQQTHFSMAKASGAQRAAEATRNALSQLPDIASISGLIMNISSGFGLTMDEVAEAIDIVRLATAENATIVVAATPVVDYLHGEFYVAMTAVYG